MADHSFKAGDIVRLRSGGPDMTVQDAHALGGVKCAWFAGKKLEQGTFAASAILPVEPKAP